MRLKHFLSVFLTLLTLGVGQMWGATRTGWTRVTTVSEITAGGTFIIGWENSANSNTIVPMINKPTTLTGTTGNNATSYLYSGTNTSSSGNGTIDMSNNGSGATTNYEFEIVEGSSSGKIAIKLSDNTYLGFYGSSNNNCRRYASVTNNSSFTPTIAATNDIVTLTNVANNSRKLSFNNNSGQYRFSNYSSSAKIVMYKKTSTCSKSVTLSKGTESNGVITTIGSTSVTTCSSTASDRRVTITITPAACFNAPDALTFTKSTGTATATMQGNKTDNGNGTFSYVYQFNQDDNGSGTFGVTCTAKPEGKTVNFNAGPGVSEETSLTETCEGAGVTLPDVNASSICKGWTTFAGWATSAVTDSTTKSGLTLYAAGDNFIPSSDGQTLYAVYSKSKGGGDGFKLSLNTNDYYVAPRSSSSNGYFSYTSNPDNAEILYLDADNHLFVYEGNTLTYISAANSTTMSFVTSNPTYAWNVVTSNGVTTLQTTQSNGRYLGFNSDRFSAYGSSYAHEFTMHSLSTTYYCSDPNCCTPLASINGSVLRTHF